MPVSQTIKNILDGHLSVAGLQPTAFCARTTFEPYLSGEWRFRCCDWTPEGGAGVALWKNNRYERSLMPLSVKLLSRLHRVDGMIRSFMTLNLFLIHYAIVHGCLVLLFIMSSLILECPGAQQTRLSETNGRRIKILRFFFLFDLTFSLFFFYFLTWFLLESWCPGR